MIEWTEQYNQLSDVLVFYCRRQNLVGFLSLAIKMRDVLSLE